MPTLSEEVFLNRKNDGCLQKNELFPTAVGLFLKKEGRRQVLVAYNILHTHALPPRIDDYEEILQETHIEGIFYNYYEKWEYNPQNSTYSLERIYLQIYMIENGNQWPLYFLHIDADEPKDSDLYSFKASPHVHMKAAPYPFNHYHHVFNSVETYDDIDKIDETFKIIINNIMHEMLASEISEGEEWRKKVNLKLEVLKKYKELYEFYYLHNKAD